MIPLCAALCVVGLWSVVRPKRRRGYLVQFRPSRGWHTVVGA